MSILFQPNEIIQDKYTIIRKIADTKSSIVYEVEDGEQRMQIMKIAKDIDSFKSGQIENEAKVLARMNNPCMPHLYDKFIWNHHYPVLMMQKMPGITLSEWIKEGQAFLLWKDIMYITDQLIDIFTYFHTQDKPFMLLDVKPSNILITKDLRISFIDFGSAVEWDGENSEKMAIGTIGFAAPEQFEVGKASLQSDLFSLGAILFYIISNGKNIYSTSLDDYEVPPNIQESYITFIKKLTEVKLQKRFSHIDEVAAAFERVKLTNQEKLGYYLQKLVRYRM